MRILILLIISLFSTIAQGQGPGVLRGMLADSSTGLPVTAATLSLLHAADSSFAGYALAGRTGEFEIRHLRAGQYILRISSRGYQDQEKTFSTGRENNTVQLGKILLAEEYIRLSEAVVSTRAAMQVKGDTTVYNLEQFKLPPGFLLEEGIKRLPGLQVQKDGTIKAMGETVQKLYVDGKEFFSNDPAVALKNLPADMVDQVQVFDEGSEQAKFTRIDDGQRSRSLNIRLKKSRNRGNFGRAALSSGTHGRYDGQLLLNHFSAAQRISLTGSASNTNKAAYQPGSSAGSGSSTFSNGNNTNGGAGTTAGTGGINESASGGINYTGQWGRRMDFRASYGYADNRNQLTQSSFKRYFFPADSMATTGTGSEAGNSGRTHRLSARLEFTIDSMQAILYTANLALKQSSLLYQDSSVTLSEGRQTYLAVMGTQFKREDRDASGFGGELLYRRRFRVPGRSLVIGWKNNQAGYESQHQLKSLLQVYTPAGNISALIDPDQQADAENNSGNNTLSLAFTQPAGSGQLLEFNYAWAVTKNIADNRAFDLDRNTGRYDEANHSLTNYFDFSQQSSRAGASFRVMKKIFNYQLGAALQWTGSAARSRQPLYGKDTVIRQRFINFFPSAGFNYTIKKGSHLRFSYRGRTQVPSITQLQDIPDNRNPLQLRTGNPGLKQEFISSYDIQYNSYHTRSAVFFSAALHVNTTANKIVSSVDSLQPAVVIIRPVNQPGNYNGSGVVTLSLPLKKLKGTSLNFSGMAYLSRETSLLFKQMNSTMMLALDQSVGLNYRSEKIDLGLRGNWLYHSLAYSIQPANNSAFSRTGWAADIQYRFCNQFFVLSSLEQVSHTGRATNFNRKILLWNMALSRQFLKQKQAEIKFTAYDLLNQDKGISRLGGFNYIEDTRVTVVPRFFLLSLSYHFMQQHKKKTGNNPAIPDAPARMHIFSNE